MNTPIAKPDNPTKTGHSFNGWYTDSALTQAWDFDDWVTGELRLYAGWTVDQHTITFDTNGGSEIASITQDYGTQITAPAAPQKTGYAFGGWYLGDTKYDFARRRDGGHDPDGQVDSVRPQGQHGAAHLHRRGEMHGVRQYAPRAGPHMGRVDIQRQRYPHPRLQAR